ncbi:MAG: hypothetical protein ACLU9S_15730 [Oscillospiraceae bacterium]
MGCSRTWQARRSPYSEKTLTGGLLSDLEQISRQAHEAVGFTYAPLEQLAALQ